MGSSNLSSWSPFKVAGETTGLGRSQLQVPIPCSPNRPFLPVILPFPSLASAACCLPPAPLTGSGARAQERPSRPLRGGAGPPVCACSLPRGREGGRRARGRWGSGGRRLTPATQRREGAHRGGGVLETPERWKRRRRRRPRRRGARSSVRAARGQRCWTTWRGAAGCAEERGRRLAWVGEAGAAEGRPHPGVKVLVTRQGPSGVFSCCRWVFWSTFLGLELNPAKPSYAGRVG